MISSVFCQRHSILEWKAEQTEKTNFYAIEGILGKPVYLVEKQITYIIAWNSQSCQWCFWGNIYYFLLEPFCAATLLFFQAVQWCRVPSRKMSYVRRESIRSPPFFYSRAFFFGSAPSPRMTFPREKNVAMKNAASPVRFWELSFWFQPIGAVSSSLPEILLLQFQLSM